VKLLLDTCAFLWAIEGGDELSPTAREALVDPANDVFLSAVSVWEIAIKHGLGRLPLPEPPERYVPAQRSARGITALALDEDAVLQLPRLPALHRDPFDRVLVCQALAGGLSIVTPDPEICRYPVRILW
jgi:PIN domain nuclease of toxin-antitoxin system